MINLMDLQPQMISKNLRGKYILLYGLPGVGKTSLAAEFEKVLLAGFEMGSNALHNVYVQPIKTWQEWKDMVKQLCKNNELKEKFHSIAIDTVDEAWSLCVKYICTQNGMETLGDLAWGQGYDIARKEFSNTFRDLAYNGYGLIYTSHSIEVNMKNDKNEEYSYIKPGLQKTPFEIINKMVDIIAYIRQIPVVDSNNNIEQKRYLFLRDPSGTRFLAKSRYKYIESQVELSYDGLTDAIYNAIDKEIAEKGGKATDEINPYVKLNFEELMEEAKEIWTKVVEKNLIDDVNKILENEFGKPTKFSEITSDDVEKLYKIIQEVKELL